MIKDEMTVAQFSAILDELARLRRFAGAWQTIDGVWVYGQTLVYYVSSDPAFHTQEYPASDISPDDRRFYASSILAAG